jgi:Ca2+-binding RTX toxin-like protein
MLNLVTGTPQDDRLDGTDQWDQLIGGLGDDLLDGGLGNDTYVFDAGFGSDTILFNPLVDNDFDTAFDQIRFSAGILAEDITVNRVGNNAVLSFPSGDTLTLEAHFLDSSRKIDRIVFGDGTIWYPWQIEQNISPVVSSQTGTKGRNILFGDASNDTLIGLDEFDILLGLEGDDTLIGGLGVDVLSGGTGNDAYIYSKGDGNDLIAAFSRYDDRSSGGFDQIILSAGISPDDIYVSRTGTSGQLDIEGAGQIVLWEQFETETAPDPNIDRIVFDDGTIWYAWKLVQLTTQSTNGNNFIAGTDGDDVIDGLAGDDELVTGAGNDRLIGGAGDDQLTGGTGSDTYFFENAFGQDKIVFDNTLIEDDGFDQILFGAGVSPQDASVTRDAAMNLLIDIGGNRITVLNHFNTPDPQIGRVKFADGTIWYNWKLASFLDFTGTAEEDQIRAIAWGSEIYGLGGNDYLSGGVGADRISGGSGNDQIDAGASDDTLIGGAGDDILTGGSGNDTYQFGLEFGKDIITGRYEEGFNQIRFVDEITSDDVSVSREADDLMLYNGSQKSSIRVEDYFVGGAQPIGRVVFVDGSIWYNWHIEQLAQTANAFGNTLFGGAAVDAIEGLAGNDVIYGFDAADQIHGGADQDHIYGGQGNDRVHGGAGDDNVQGNAGDDTVIGGAGDDTLAGQEGNDTYYFQAGFGQDVVDNSDPAYDRFANAVLDFDRIVFSDDFTPEDFTVLRDTTNNLVLIAPDGSNVKVIDHFQSEIYRINEVVFADGTIWTPTDLLDQSRMPNGLDNLINGTNDADTLNGLGGDDTIYGVGGDDTLSGDAGNDTIYGQVGNDTIYGGAGNDTLFGDEQDDQLFGGAGDDWLNPGRGNDTIDGGEGIDMMTFDGLFQRGLVVDLSEGFASYSSGSVMFSNIESLTGNYWDDTLIGDDGANTLRGLWGDDMLFGMGGDDRLYGSYNSDFIDGGDGYDRAYFSGNRYEYEITTENGSTSVEHKRDSWHGADTLINVEVLVFENENLVL